jgi:hypothetical protein
MVQAEKSKKRKQSTRLVRLGGLISETFTIFQGWDISKPTRENLRRVKETNSIGAKSQGWLREVTITLLSRFPNSKSIESLVILAKGSVNHEIWKACLFWHVAEANELYYRFASEWLFKQYEAGTYLIKTSDVIPFVHELTDGKIGGGNLGEYSVTRLARDLLRMASQFGLLTDTTVRQFTSYHLPEDAFIYLLHVIAEREPNPNRIINSPDWRLYLMSPKDVELELLRLHQYRKVHYEVAGSLVQLKLPFTSAVECAKEMVE